MDTVVTRSRTGRATFCTVYGRKPYGRSHIRYGGQPYYKMCTLVGVASSDTAKRCVKKLVKFE
jgi:hypothetical protein